MSTDFDSIELYVMKKILLDGNVDHAILMKQYNNLISVQRKVSPCGWYTDFTIKDNTEKIVEKKLFRIGEIVLQVSGLESGIGFGLYVENGQIATLEAYTFEEDLPESFEINFTAQVQRI